jgi:hypothetical protein
LHQLRKKGGIGKWIHADNVARAMVSQAPGRESIEIVKELALPLQSRALT